eukprot:TRINITY_DN16804_c0_g1_i1.p1 TRINITY_DN16804_c0_g1~~TRINITY_DN16804_c0_g1_i1.p1  ORF type:complete len:268 (+),score=45.01 TRINITY_DN16804_c0_g1_i1:105-908(+)
MKAERNLLSKNSKKGNATIDFIGEILAPFADRNGTPRQPGIVPSALSILKLKSAIIAPESLRGLVEYGHIYVLFWFHLNTNQGRSLQHKPLVAPPRGGGQKIGVFACRSPHRPNPVGLSLVEVVAVDERKGEITVRGLDCIHGTPIVDIKPYIPEAERPPTDTLRSPSWVQMSYDSSNWTRYTITYTKEATVGLTNLEHLHSKWCSSVDDFIRETLQTDFRSARQKNIVNFEGSLRLQKILIRYNINMNDETVTVTAVELRESPVDS